MNSTPPTARRNALGLQRVFVVVCAGLLQACYNVSLAEDATPYRNLSVLEVGTPRPQVLAELLQPVGTETDQDGNEVDVYSLPQEKSSLDQGTGNSESSIGVSFNAMEASATPDPSEVLRAAKKPSPSEGRRIQIRVTYDKNNLLKQARMRKDTRWVPIQRPQRPRQPQDDTRSVQVQQMRVQQLMDQKHVEDPGEYPDTSRITAGFWAPKMWYLGQQRDDFPEMPDDEPRQRSQRQERVIQQYKDDFKAQMQEQQRHRNQTPQNFRQQRNGTIEGQMRKLRRRDQDMQDSFDMQTEALRRNARQTQDSLSTQAWDPLRHRQARHDASRDADSGCG